MGIGITLEEAIHAILLGFHTNTETFQSANKRIQHLIGNESQKAAMIAARVEAENCGGHISF
jgi:hypothetical protein